MVNYDGNTGYQTWLSKIPDYYDEVVENGGAPYCDDCIDTIWSLLETYQLPAA